jgi:hypothetical protein
MTMSKQYKYVVVDAVSSHGLGNAIFRGKTERSARIKAEDYLLGHMPSSREDYEAEHGKVSDEKWIEGNGEKRLYDYPRRA